MLFLSKSHMSQTFPTIFHRSLKKWEIMDLNSTSPSESQKVVAMFREKRTANTNDTSLIEELVLELEEKLKKLGKANDTLSEVQALERHQKINRATDVESEVNILDKL